MVKPEPMKKTSLQLPPALWRAAKVRALDEGTDLRTVIIRALEAYLRTEPRGGSRASR
jgi:hypothetical protein